MRPSEETKNYSKQHKYTYNCVYSQKVFATYTYALAYPFVVLVVAFDADITDFAVLNIIGTWCKLPMYDFTFLTKLE